MKEDTCYRFRRLPRVLYNLKKWKTENENGGQILP